MASEAEVFEPMTLAEITAATAKEATDKVDHEWAERISSLGIGGGFKIRRSEGEPTRTLKTRINRAAMASWRELTWYPQSGNLTDAKPASYVVKVKAIRTDLKNKADAEAAQNGQNGTVQATQPTNVVPSTNPTPDNSEAAAARVRGR